MTTENIKVNVSTEQPIKVSTGKERTLSVNLDSIELNNASFTNLNDTPSTLSGYGGKKLKVKSDETGIEFSESDVADWGSIDGTLSDQIDLQSALDLKADTSDLGDYQLLSEKDQPDGYPGLNADGNLIGTYIMRNDTEANIDTIVLDEAELAYTTDTEDVRVGDGTTSGGKSVTEGYVPYTGATGDVDIGANDIYTGDIITPKFHSGNGILYCNSDAEPIDYTRRFVVSSSGFINYRYFDGDWDQNFEVKYEEPFFDLPGLLRIEGRGFSSISQKVNFSNFSEGVIFDNMPVRISDNYKLFFGLDDDSSIYYDGTNLHINAQEVGTGTVILDNLPTSDPVVAGGIWNDGGTLKISSG